MSAAAIHETLVALLRHRAATQPDAKAYTFLEDGEREAGTLTFAELDRRARAIAVQLLRVAAPGERALLLHPPGIDYVPAFFGCLYAGVVGVLVVGYGIGWWFRGLRFISDRAVADEMWNRKLKFAEQQALEAQAQATRFGAQHLTQEKAMHAAREWTEELEQELNARGEKIHVLERELGEQRARVERLGRDLAHRDEYRSEIEGENESLNEESERLRADLDLAREELAVLQRKESELETAHAELEDLNPQDRAS